MKINKIYITIILLIISASTSFFFYSQQKQYVKNVEFQNSNKLKNEIVVKAKELENTLNAIMRKTSEEVDAIASILEGEKPQYDRLVSNMKNSLESYSFTAIGAHFASHSNNEKIKKALSDYVLNTGNKTLYTPFFRKNDTSVNILSYDYTDMSLLSKNKGWYDETISTGSWFGPYFGYANKQMLMSYRSPFQWNETKQLNGGLIVADYSLSSLRSIIGDIDLLEKGYGFLVDNSGKIIAHPLSRYLGKKVSKIQEVKLSMNKLDDVERKCFKNFQVFNDDGFNLEKVIVYALTLNLENDLKWKLVFVVPWEDVFTTDGDANGKMSFYHIIFVNKLYVVFSFCVALCTALVLLSFLVRMNAWWLSGGITLICLSSLSIVISLHLKISDLVAQNELVVYDDTGVEGVLNKTLRENKGVQENFIRIPTGIYVQSIKFASANDVKIRGYLWQKKNENWGNIKNSPTWKFPEAEELEYQLEYEDENLIRWSFYTQLRQQFDYSNYPFDYENIWIRIRYPLSGKRKIVLVPDFSSYPPAKSKNKIGVQKEIILEGWNIWKTFYSFKKYLYGSSFGIEDENLITSENLEMQFNIGIKRNFVNVLMVYMIPMIVVAFLLFSVLMVRTKDKEKNTWLGFSTIAILGYCGSLFFVLIVSHLSMRESLNTKGVIYLEYYLFVLYIMLAIVSTNSILFSYKEKVSIYPWKRLEYYYWPITLSSLLIITSLVFTHFN